MLHNGIFFTRTRQNENLCRDTGAMLKKKVYYVAVPLMHMLFFALLLVSCSGENDCCPSIVETAKSHKQKLRAHFMGNGRITDISTLIEETRRISARLKKENKYTEARKFDSYTDVLMFGNNTIDESLNDVMELIGQGKNTEKSADGSGKKHCPSLIESLCELLQI
ncbi:MAG: hypothetical protein LBB12_04325 [Holosporaceae bacterium]|jgi:hypothetical protein|nr:hypothetical protein [Holosporaceae bacterium]